MTSATFRLCNVLEELERFIHCVKKAAWKEIALASLSAKTFFFKFLKKLINFWLRWVFIAAHGLSLVAVSRGYFLLWCAGFSLWWLLLLRSMGSRCSGSEAVARGL